MSNNSNVLVVKGVLSYPYLLTPNKEGKYETTLLIDKKDKKTKRSLDLGVKNAEEEGMKGVWKGIKPNGNLSPVKDGDGTRDNGNPYSDECKGKWLLRAFSKFKPTVLKPDKLTLKTQPRFMADVLLCYQSSFSHITPMEEKAFLVSFVMFGKSKMDSV